MNDHVAQVDQHPFAGVFALDADHVAAGFLDLVADRSGQRLGLAVRGAGDNRDTVEQAGQVHGIEYLDVLAFDVLERIDDEGLKFFNIH